MWMRADLVNLPGERVAGCPASVVLTRVVASVFNTFTFHIYSQYEGWVHESGGVTTVGLPDHAELWGGLVVGVPHRLVDRGSEARTLVIESV